MDSSIQIEECAAAWLAKRDGGAWCPADEAQLTQWLEVSTAHYIAFIRLEAAWEHGKRLKALSPGAGEIPAVGQQHFSPFFFLGRKTTRMNRFWRGPTALAAGVLVVLTTGILWYWDAFRADHYVTPVGKIISVPMADGSKITLNTASELRVELSKTKRLIELEQGEAFFEVAKDPKRPFVVSAGKQRVIAVGTKFSVRRDGNQLRVIVTEGLVRLEEEGEVLKTSADLNQLAAGSVARTTVDKVLIDRKPLREAEDYLSWRSGYLVFHESSLAEAAVEFNRYNTQKIVIEDSAAAAVRFSGKFRASNLEAFVRILENGFPLHAALERDRIVLSSR